VELAELACTVWKTFPAGKLSVHSILWEFLCVGESVGWYSMGLKFKNQFYCGIGLACQHSVKMHCVDYTMGLYCVGTILWDSASVGESVG
jgi:hypothetical protein